ncbi:hypothetical protein ACFLTD_04125, partial [Elusimicrobiota bacterium]
MKLLNSIYIKITSWVLIISFVFVYILGDYAHASKYTQIKEDLKYSWDIEVPMELGKVIARYEGRRSDTRVILIQDLHANVQTQSNIKGILEHIDKNYGISRVGVEGSSGKVDTSLISSIPDKDIREDVVKYFMDKAMITGAEGYAVYRDIPVLEGLEDRALYEKNSKLLLGSLGRRPEFVGILERIKEHLRAVEDRICTKDLKGFRNKYILYRQKELDPAVFHKYLRDYSKKAGIDIRRVSGEYHLFMELNRKYSTLNYNSIESEYKKLLKKLEITANSDDSLKDTLKRFKNYFRLPSDLRSQMQQEIYASDDYRNLRTYLECVELSKRVDSYRVIHEEDKLVRKVSEGLSKTEAEKSYIYVSDYIQLLVKFLLNQMTPVELDEFYGNSEKFLEKFNELSTGNIGDLSVIDELLVSLKLYIEEMGQFYSIALERDKHFIKNFVDKESKKGSKNIALVTGGFHTYGLAKLLKDKGISYIAVKPVVTEHNDEDRARYYSFIRGGELLSYEDVLSLTLAPMSFLPRPWFRKRLVARAIGKRLRTELASAGYVIPAQDKLKNFLKEWKKGYVNIIDEGRDYSFSIEESIIFKDKPVFELDLEGEKLLMGFSKKDMNPHVIPKDQAEELQDEILKSKIARLNLALAKEKTALKLTEENKITVVAPGNKPISLMDKLILAQGNDYITINIPTLKRVEKLLKKLNENLNILNTDEGYFLYDRKYLIRALDGNVLFRHERSEYIDHLETYIKDTVLNDKVKRAALLEGKNVLAGVLGTTPDTGIQEELVKVYEFLSDKTLQIKPPKNIKERIKTLSKKTLILLLIGRVSNMVEGTTWYFLGFFPAAVLWLTNSLLMLLVTQNFEVYYYKKLKAALKNRLGIEDKETEKTDSSIRIIQETGRSDDSVLPVSKQSFRMPTVFLFVKSMTMLIVSAVSWMLLSPFYALIAKIFGYLTYEEIVELLKRKIGLSKRTGPLSGPVTLKQRSYEEYDGRSDIDDLKKKTDKLKAKVRKSGFPAKVKMDLYNSLYALGHLLNFGDRIPEVDADRYYAYKTGKLIEGMKIPVNMNPVQYFRHKGKKNKTLLWYSAGLQDIDFFLALQKNREFDSKLKAVIMSRFLLNLLKNHDLVYTGITLPGRLFDNMRFSLKDRIERFIKPAMEKILDPEGQFKEFETVLPVDYCVSALIRLVAVSELFIGEDGELKDGRFETRIKNMIVENPTLNGFSRGVDNWLNKVTMQGRIWRLYNRITGLTPPHMELTKGSKELKELQDTMRKAAEHENFPYVVSISFKMDGDQNSMFFGRNAMYYLFRRIGFSEPGDKLVDLQGALGLDNDGNAILGKKMIDIQIEGFDHMDTQHMKSVKEGIKEQIIELDERGIPLNEVDIYVNFEKKGLFSEYITGNHINIDRNDIVELRPLFEERLSFVQQYSGLVRSLVDRYKPEDKDTFIRKVMSLIDTIENVSSEEFINRFTEKVSTNSPDVSSFIKLTDSLTSVLSYKNPGLKKVDLGFLGSRKTEIDITESRSSWQRLNDIYGALGEDDARDTIYKAAEIVNEGKNIKSFIGRKSGRSKVKDQGGYIKLLPIVYLLANSIAILTGLDPANVGDVSNILVPVLIAHAMFIVFAGFVVWKADGEAKTKVKQWVAVNIKGGLWRLLPVLLLSSAIIG